MDGQDPRLRQLQQQLQQRRVHKRQPQRIGETVARLLSRRGYAQQETAAELAAAWRSAVGPRLAAQSRPGIVRRGVLEVLVSNSTALQEINFDKARVLRRLRELAPDRSVRDLRLRVGDIG